MSEFIVIQVGQCGNQIGSCLLPGILQEYEISGYNNDSDSKKRPEKADLQKFISSFFNFEHGNFSTFDTISDLVAAKAKARFICIDMEDSVVARCKLGKLRDLYDKKNLITNYPGSGNNWAEGHCSHGPKYKQTILKTIQYNVEQCDKLHGFIVMFSVGGGTGSGLGTYIVKLLADYYSHIERFIVPVYPTGTEDVVTCPYNMAFSTEQLINNATCVFPVENRSLLDIMLRLNNRYCDNFNRRTSSFRPFDDMNSIIVDLVLHLTSGCRFGGKMNIDINDINTNMIPFPKLNFLSSGFSPISGAQSNKYDTLAQPKLINVFRHWRNELFLSSCHRTNQLIKVDPMDSRYITMGLTLLGRGNYSINDMRQYVEKLKVKLRTPVWSNKSIKLGLCNIPPKGFDYSMLSLCNSTSTSIFFQEIHAQFMKLYQRKAHIHHYLAISDFEKSQFNECQNALRDIIEFYKSIDKTKPLLS